MHKFFATLIFISICFGIIFYNQVDAISSNVVISLVQLGDENSSSNELVGIYNNSAEDIDITNWCVYYASASSSNIGSKMGCFSSDTTLTHIFLPAKSSAIFVSNQYLSANPELGYDEKFSATLLGAAGHVRLLDSNKNEIDRVGWGGAVLPESLSSDAPIVGNVLTRHFNNENDTYLDSDDNFNDFEIIQRPVSYEYGNIYEVDDLCSNLDGVQAEIPEDLIVSSDSRCVLPPVDMCSNIDDLQIIVPVGFAIDEYDQCVPDLCSNIEGIQSMVPDGLIADEQNNCILPDLCPNILEIQNPIPHGYFKNDSGCFADLSKLEISELLPNAIDLDNGNEFIEIYNPNSETINLEDYRLIIEPSGDSFTFPDGASILPQQYLAFYNNQISFTLINTTGSVKIMSFDNQEIDSSEIYLSPTEGSSWAKIDGLWQHTNQSTPGLKNTASIIIEEVVTLAPCGFNQYRSPETNRCRNLSTGSILAACKDGQYRSEETGRCRSLASDVSTLLPCAEGEERNPDTNRCRKIGTVLGATDLKTCAEGQYRNPETNRCRNIVSLAKADYAPEETAASSDDYLITFSYISVLILAVSYGVWEWRTDIVKLLKKFRKLVHFR